MCWIMQLHFFCVSKLPQGSLWADKVWYLNSVLHIVIVWSNIEDASHTQCTVWCQMFEEYNFHCFCGFVLDHENHTCKMFFAVYGLTYISQVHTKCLHCAFSSWIWFSSAIMMLWILVGRALFRSEHCVRCCIVAVPEVGSCSLSAWSICLTANNYDGNPW